MSAAACSQMQVFGSHLPRFETPGLTCSVGIGYDEFVVIELPIAAAAALSLLALLLDHACGFKCGNGH
jgi:hypothetical protein